MPASSLLATLLATRAAVRGEHVSSARRPWTGNWRGLVLPLALLVLLEVLVRVGWIPAHQLPAPSHIGQTLWWLAAGGELWGHIGVSLARVAAGFVIGAALAVLIGAWVGLSRRAESYLEPSFQALRAIPSLAWVPLLLLWLGIDETPKVVLIALGAFFPVYLALLAGIRNVDRKLVEVGRLHRLSGVALTRRILLPAALPSLFTGLRGALSLSWMFLVAAELIAATRGLGYLLSDGRETSRPDLVIAAILLLALLGKLSDSLLKAIETRALHWRDSFAGGEA
jgi:sulfonate transport system permease protein